MVREQDLASRHTRVRLAAEVEDDLEQLARIDALVQGTSEMLSRFAGVPYKEMKWKCAGINHLAWFTELRGPDGVDLYPGLFEQARDRSSGRDELPPTRRCEAQRLARARPPQVRPTEQGQPRAHVHRSA